MDCCAIKSSGAATLCQTYRKKLLALCCVDDVAAEVPIMLDEIRGRLGGDIELSDLDLQYVFVVQDALEFLLATEPAEPSAGGHGNV